MKNFFSKYRFHLLLLITVVILFVINYSPGTYLSGWDNLQTELNPGLAVKRAVFSVWEEYQSFGLAAGMAHAADLVRASFSWIMSFVLPQNIIRYFYHFFMLFLGGLGVLELFGGGGLAFFGALFYMLNLGTIQMFYLPFEPFSTFFAFLPWGIWSFMRLLRSAHNEKKAWLFFLLINLLGTPSFYTQQLFVVYLLFLGCIASTNLKNLKRVLLAFCLIFLINSFWILPQFYFLATNGGWVTQAKVNQIATEDTLYQNLSKGTLGNFLRLEGFYFDLSGVNTPLFAPWKDHFKGIFGLIPFLFIGLMILGLTKTIKEKKYEFLLILFLCALVLLSVTPPFSWLNTLFRQNSFINQIFRSPFTKFIIPYSLVYAYFVTQGIRQIVQKRHRILILFSILIFLYSLPAFQGYFISPEMKIKIPNDYFQVMDYFKSVDKNKRIVLLPDYTFWGWFFNNWGYNGSGFLWYGIEQPIVSRTFDVWSPKSESYFWENKQVFESESLPEIEKVLDKYNVDYLMLDYSLIPVVSSYKSLALDRIENLLSQSERISLIFRGENVALYQVSHSKQAKDFISLSSGLTNIGPEVKLMAEDHAYKENGDYISKKDYDLFYPFADLTTQTRLGDKNWELFELENSFSLTANLDINPNDYGLTLKSTSEASISNNGEISYLKLNLNSSFEGKKFDVSFEKLLIKSFDVSGFNNDSEFALSAPELPQKYGYLIKIRSRNVKGSPLFFYVIDDTKKQSMIEEKLRNETEYFVLPHKFDYGLGYTISFQNKSYENYPSENALEEVSIYLFPYEELKNAKFTKNGSNLKISNFYDDFEAKKINYFTYKATANSGNAITLNQSYDEGWLGIANGKILPHVKVNNWANGWILDDQISPKSIQIIFWPQYLEFLGFALLAIGALRILIIKK